MRLIANRIFSAALARLRCLPGSEDGFTMLMAIGVFITTTVLVSTAFVAAQGDTHLTQHDLNGKRAYYAARAGSNAFLHRLNRNANYWQTCPTQTTTAVPGSGSVPGSSVEQYSYKPVPSNPAVPCSLSAPIDTMIDTDTGSFRMQFSGYAGSNPQVERHIIASFRRDSPLDYLWYTVYETLDPNVRSDPSNYQDCNRWARGPNSRPSHCGNIDWITGDNIKGPMYTQDQYAICGRPIFGRGPSDLIRSAAPPSAGGATFDDCGGSNADVRGVLQDGAGYVPLPTYNTRLMADAQTGNGIVVTGPTIVRLAGPLVYITNASMGWTNKLFVIPWGVPIIYAANGSGCNPVFDVTDVDYTNAMAGTCGNIYVYGPYSQSVTIAAENDIIIGNPAGVVSSSDNIQTDPDGPAMLGLVANNFVRVMHGCNGNNDSGYTRPNLEIDAAILALQHSFIVDNYRCGSPIGRLIVTGAIAQKFRGTVGTHSGSTVSSGYVKDYTYDDRLRSVQPPYMFDIQNASWHLDRETPCQNAGPDPATAC